MTAPEKTVHVVPMGLEKDRVIEGLRRYPTNHAIFIHGKTKHLKVEQLARRNTKDIQKLIKSTIRVDILELDLYDFESAFVELKSLFDDLKSQGYRIYVNISTGTRIVSAAALLAAFMTNAVPYYVIPKEYNLPKGKNVLSTGTKGVVQLPSLGINTPTKKELVILDALLEKGSTVDRQNALMDALPKSFFGDKKDDEDQSSFKARNRAKANRVLQQLAQKGFVVMEKKGRNVSVNLTESGKILVLLERSEKRKKR
jgi:CRISPR-associated protein Csa3